MPALLNPQPCAAKEALEPRAELPKCYNQLTDPGYSPESSIMLMQGPEIQESWPCSHMDKACREPGSFMCGACPSSSANATSSNSGNLSLCDGFALPSHVVKTGRCIKHFDKSEVALPTFSRFLQVVIASPALEPLAKEAIVLPCITSTGPEADFPHLSLQP